MRDTVARRLANDLASGGAFVCIVPRQLLTVPIWRVLVEHAIRRVVFGGAILGVVDVARVVHDGLDHFEVNVRHFHLVELVKIAIQVVLGHGSVNFEADIVGRSQILVFDHYHGQIHQPIVHLTCFLRFRPWLILDKFAPSPRLDQVVLGAALVAPCPFFLVKEGRH